MYVGSIVHPNQGVPILIEALPRVFEAVPSARCVLVGGPAEAGVAYQAQLGVHGDRLIVLTGQTPEQVVALSRRADVLVHPRLACRENLLGPEQDRRLPRRGPADRGDRFRRLPVSPGSDRRGALDTSRSPTAGRRHHQGPDRPALAASLAAATAPVAREFFAMDRNIDRYLDVYDRAIEHGPG